MGNYLKLKRCVANALDDDKSTKIDRIVDGVIISLIVISTIEIFLSTFSSINARIGGLLHIVDIFTTVVFTIEVTLRIWVADLINPKYKGLFGRLRYCCSFYGLIDILATYPFYLGFFFPIPYEAFKVLRIARLLRIFRYMKSFKLLKAAFMSKKAELLVSFQFLCIITLILSFILFFVENEAQPEVYNNGWRSVIWAFNQYIKDPGGFGDTPPITTVGRLIACAIGVLKVAIFAVPAGLIGSGFLQAVNAEKEQEQLIDNRSKLYYAFERKLDVYTGFHISPLNMSVADIQASQRLSDTEIFKTIDSTPDFRIINLASTMPIDKMMPDKLAVEHFVLNRSYGCFIDRKSPVTIVAPSSSIDAGVGHYAYYLAKIGGFNLVSRELGVSRPYRSFYNQTYAGEVAGLSDFMDDLNALTADEGSWVVTLLPSSGISEPEFPSQIHIEYGGKKGDSTFDAPDLLVKDIPAASRLFDELADVLDGKYGFQTDRQAYHSTDSPQLFMRKLDNASKVNGFVLRIAYSAFLWNSRRVDIAKTIADVLQRNITGKELSVTPEMKLKDFGFRGYSNYKIN